MILKNMYIYIIVLTLEEDRKAVDTAVQCHSYMLDIYWQVELLSQSDLGNGTRLQAMLN